MCHHTTPPDFEPFEKSAFEALCDDVLLERCLKGATQNRIESFNIIWSKAPKTEYCSLATIETAVSHTTIIFNSGAVALEVLEGLGLEVGLLCMATLSAHDKVHVQKSVRKEEEVAKKRRKRKRQTEMSVEEARIEEEGVTYETEAF